MSGAGPQSVKVISEGHMSGYSMAKQNDRISCKRDTWLNLTWLNRLTEDHVRGTHEWI